MNSRHPVFVLLWVLADAVLGVFSATFLVALPALSVGVVVGPAAGLFVSLVGLAGYFLLSEALFPVTYRVSQPGHTFEDEGPDELFHLSVSTGIESESAD